MPNSVRRRSYRRFLLNAYLNCFWCGVRLVKSGNPHQQDSFTMDHVVPSGLGGANGLTNIVAACRQCNQLRAQFYAKYRANPELLRYLRMT